ncbi:DUF6017 domain-containing protein [uncultured Parvimonas sp.]|uniref:DUF6017 domain-containing protein n=1 Tax=uncultured Parvimonas sp. TaxID=747372 RepID=UPI002805B3ED|nr:DUF6017 domain-containing protein [uncultured Parvimonas sp.]
MKYKDVNNELFYSENDYYQEYRFIKTPAILISSKLYQNLSLGAKMLYSILADRQSLSLKNKDKYTDENGKIFLIYTIESLKDVLCLSKNTVIKYKKELIEFELLFERRMGQGLANRIYILKPKYQELAKNTRSPRIELLETQNLDFKKSEICTSRSAKNEPLEVQNLHPNYTNINHTDSIYTNSINQSEEIDSDVIEYKKYKDLIYKNLNYEILELSLSKTEMEYLNQIIEVMLDVILSKDEKIRVSGNYISKELVKMRFLLLTYSHIEYVLSSIRKNSKKAKNIRSYLITCLYNSYSTELVQIDNEISDDFSDNFL